MCEIKLKKKKKNFKFANKKKYIYINNKYTNRRRVWNEEREICGGGGFVSERAMTFVNKILLFWLAFFCVTF